MEKERLEIVLHQYLLMYRDPVVYMAIAENSGGFDADEIIYIRMVKAKALIGMYKLDAAVEAAKQVYHKLKKEQFPVELQILNLFTLIHAHYVLGNQHTMKSYTEEANILAVTCEEDMIKLLVECVQITFLSLNHLDEEMRIQRVSDALDRAEHPFYRLSLLSWLGFSYRRLRKYDLALGYYSAAYDLSIRHGLSISSLEICVGIIACCANLQNLEMGEEFYAIGKRLVAQLRLSLVEAFLSYNYALLKYALKDYKAAVLFFQRSNQILNSSENQFPRQRFDIYTNLSKALNHLDLGEQALHFQLLAEKLLQDPEDQDGKMYLNSNIAWSLMELGRYDEALMRLKLAERYYRQKDNLEMQIKITRGLAYFYRKKKNWLRSLAMQVRVDNLCQRQITILQQFRSKASESKLQSILNDSKAIQQKYENLLNDVSRRQSERFTGNSKAAKRVIDSAVLASLHKDASVLIQGESGSGKEVLARMIHYGSAQKNLPFISVNCAAISVSLFETEFFGSAAGELTGLNEERPGYFVQAGEGTLFLDEIAEMPQDFQAKLLWAMDTKTYTPVGSDAVLPIKCRIIASTNRDVLDLMKSNVFRLDLMHRLNTLEIGIPPLRDRLEDIPLLVEGFARNYARETTRRFPQIRDSFYDRLNGYKFPGNVRELKNIIERIFILFYEPIWTAEILDNIDAFRRSKHISGSLIEHNIKDLDKERIIEALRKTGGKQKTAAKLLNMSESTLCRKIKRYHIK